MNPQNDNPLPFPGLDLIFVEGGIFIMGDNNSQNHWEKPEHEVKVSSFHIGKYQVTQRLWQAVTGNNPSNFKGEKRPVETVSWNDAQEFIEKLNAIDTVQQYLQKLDPPGVRFRFPTEAEWEFAARGGNKSEKYRYAGSAKLKEVGWYRDNSYGETKPIGLKFPNELGIFDMSGNVWEWCEDDWHDNYNGAPKDGSAWIDSPERGVRRVYRGGSSFYLAGYCRSAFRDSWLPDSRYTYFGFRLVVPSQSVG